jgi:hypothetical protein
MAPDLQSAADCEIDEALWTAYRRYDKSAVTKQLLRRYLTTVTAVACCSHGPTGRRPRIKSGAQVDRTQARGYNSSISNRPER